MRILITGGAGLIGSHAAEYYAKKRAKVVVLDNLMRSKLFGYDKRSVEFNWNYLKRYKNIALIKGDVRNRKDVIKAIGRGVDAVIHTAAQPGVPSSVRMPVDDFTINAFGTLNVLECVRQKCKGAALIYCSTNKVFGENVDKIPLEEKETRYIYRGVTGVDEGVPTDLSGHTPYGVSKLTGDLYAQEYHYIYGMKTGIFRMSCIYGVRQFGFEDQGWAAWFVVANLLKKKITIYGDGKQVRDMLYVTDLIEAYDRFLASGIRHDVFNMGGGPSNTTSLLEFIKDIEGQTGIKMKYAFSDWRPSDQKVYVSDIRKASRTLNWQPKTSPQEGLRLIVEWVKANIGIFK